MALPALNDESEAQPQGAPTAPTSLPPNDNNTPLMDENEMNEAQNDEAYMRYIQDYYNSGEEPQTEGAYAPTSSPNSGTQTLNFGEESNESQSANDTASAPPAEVEGVSGGGDDVEIAQTGQDGFNVEVGFEVPQGRPMTYREFKRYQNILSEPRQLQPSAPTPTVPPAAGEEPSNNDTQPPELNSEQQNEAATDLARPSSPASPGENVTPLINADIGDIGSGTATHDTTTPEPLDANAQNEAASELARNQAQQQTSMQSGLQAEIAPLDDQITALENQHKINLRRDKAFKIETTIAKLGATAEFILPILWYLIKLLYILLVYRGSRKTKKIEREALNLRSKRESIRRNYQSRLTELGRNRRQAQLNAQNR